MSKNKSAWNLIVITLIALMVSCNGPVAKKNFHEDSLKFNSEEWINSVKGEIGFQYGGSRSYMLHDLLTNHLKPGMDTVEVKALLGEPLPRITLKNSFAYHLGVHREMEASFLRVNFNDQWKVNEIHVVEY